MSIVTLDWDQSPAADLRGAALTMGNFDGVHRGHAALLTHLRREAGALGAPAVVLTFDPHPLKLLRPQQFQPLLTTVTDRAELLQAQGADHVLMLRTTLQLLHLSAREFFEQVIRMRLQARAIVSGFNFAFGHNREGTLDVLAAFCREVGLGFVVAPPLELDGKPISSSRVRSALVRGDAREATVLLGRPYRLRGVVGKGQERGRTIGFPTANLERVETLVPGEGVYAVRVQHGGKVWPGAANIGPNPTFGEQERKIEVHLIGFEGKLYDESLAVDFVERLRDTRPFSGVAELVEQLRVDVEQARRLVDPAL
jgi:riboflavin kinase/FMN adenylyltransferase